MAALGFFTGDDTPDSYEARERKRRLAEALIQQGSDYSPVQSWTQGAARLANALSGTIQQNRIGKQEKESSEAYNKLAMSLLGGGSPSPAPSTSVNSAPGPMADAGESKPASFGGSQAKFVEALMPHAMKVSQETGIDPRVVIAQSALETGWGKSAPGNNFFGIKSHGRAGGNTLATTENVGGQNVSTSDSFRAYGDMGESANDYAAFLKSNPRYQPMLQAQGMDAQIAALAKSGYATDPMYGNKVSQIARGIQVPQQAPVQAASLDGLPPGPVASDAPPMAYAGAPAGQAISGASPQPPARPPGQQLAQAVAPTSPPIPQPQPTGNVNAAMYQIMSDPRFSPQQKAQALQMFQMQQSLNTRNPMVIPEGGRAIVPDGRGGYREVATGGPKMTNEQRNFEAARANPDFANYQERMKRAGASSVNIDQKTETVADAETAKALIKRNVAAMDAADKAQAAMGDINTMREISQRVGSLGASADVKRAIGPYAEALGINIENLSDIQAFESVIQRMAPTLRAEGSGSTSDIEFKGMLASLPRLSSNPQARAMILDTMEANARYNMQRGDIALKVLTKEIKREDGEKQMRALGDPMQAFKEFRKSNPDLFSGGAAQPKQPEMTPQERALEELRRRSRS